MKERQEDAVDPSTGLSRDSASLAAMLTACASDDRKAFRDLYAATASKVFGIVCMVIYDRAVAEEVTQEVYLQIWRRAKTFDPATGHPMAWIASIARNKAIDRLRADRSRGFVAFSNEVPEIADHRNGQDARAEVLAIQKGLAQLRPEYRDILLLAYFQGYTQEEAATALGIPVGTAKTWLKRGLTALREAME